MKLSLFLQNIQNVSELKKNYRLEKKEIYIYLYEKYLFIAILNYDRLLYFIILKSNFFLSTYTYIYFISILLK